MRKKLVFSIAVVAALLLTAGTAERAEAAGVQFRAGGLHLDFGDPHRSAACYGGGRGGYAYGGRGGHHAYRGNGARSYHGYRGGYRTWHDTTHLDWHPGGYVPHGNHFDYVPGHYDVHRDGHWDYHH